MSVPQIIKKATTNYVEKFKTNPEEMAASYACLAVASCLAYACLVLATRELDRKESELEDLYLSIALHRSFMNGFLDAYNDYDRESSCCCNDSKNRKCNY